MGNKGLVFTCEALLALLFFCFLFLSLNFQIPESSLQELYLLQKSHDLLSVWGLERNFSEKELLSDIKLVFPDNCVVLQIDGKILNNCKKTESFFTTSREFFTNPSDYFEIHLTVYY